MGRPRFAPPAGGGGGGGTATFFSQWTAATGNSSEATEDGTGGARKWNDASYCLDRRDIMQVVTAATADSSRPGNVFRVSWADNAGAGCGFVQRLDAVGLGESHYGRMFFNRRDRVYDGSVHNFSYNFLGGIQIVFFNPNARAGGWRVTVGLPADFPFTDWGIQTGVGSDALNPPFVLFDFDTWYLYEWRMEYLSGGTRFRFYPRISTASGTLLYDHGDFYQMSTPTQGTATLESWYAAGNDFPVNDAELHRNIGIGNEGRPGSGSSGLFYDVADFAIGTGDWLGTTTV